MLLAVPLYGIIQCLLLPAIPCQVSSPGYPDSVSPGNRCDTRYSVDISEIGIICLVILWLGRKQIIFIFQVFQNRQERIQYDAFKIVRDLVHFDFIDILVFNLFHEKILYSEMNRFALSDSMGFLLLIRFFAGGHLYLENHVGIHGFFVGEHRIGQ